MSAYPIWFYYLAVAGFGLIFGSFFNVVIYRLPKDVPLGGHSSCPECGMTIRWYDNVPLLSYAILKGRCRGCRKPISLRYPLVEAMTASLFALAYWWSRGLTPTHAMPPGRHAVTPEFFIGLLMVCVLIIVSAVDFTDGIVPNRIVYPGLIAMIALVTGVALYRGQPGRIGLSLAGGAIGGGFLLAAGLIYGAIFLRGKPAEVEDGDGDDENAIPTGIGMGDVKLIAFSGFVLGYFHWYLVTVQLFVGFLLGALASVPLLVLARKGRQDKLPFAPFLSAGAVIALVWGKQLVDIYLKLLR